MSIIPAAIQSRLAPSLRSVRKSVSMQTLNAPCPGRKSGHTPARSLSGIDVLPVTPPPSSTADEDEDDRRLCLLAHDATPPPDYPASSGTRLAPSAPISTSGVRWRYAHQGISLLNIAQDETRQPMSRPGTDFERKAFLDGVEYLLKALPENLSSQELERLQNAAPAGVVQFSISTDPNDPRRYVPFCGSTTGQPRSVLHRAVQAAVVQIFILVHMLLPYALLLMRLAARAERDHKVSQTVVTAGLGLANSIGSSGVRVTTMLCNMGDGKVGQALGDAVAWTVEGVAGGLTEGVGEGLHIVSAPRQ